MIAACVLPLLVPMSADPSQVLISLLEGTLPTDDGVSSRWNQGSCSGLLDGAITLFEVIRPIRGLLPTHMEKLLA